MRATLLLLMAASAFAATPADYLLLQTGNQWIYSVSGRVAGAPVTTSVGRSTDFGNQSYVNYTGFGESQWLRADATGAIYIYDPETKSERALISADGAVTRRGVCNQTGHVVSTDARYSGPIGTFRGGVVEIRYDPGSCADAGIVNEFYLPYVGLLQRTETTIGGPVTYDLVYARVGGVLVATASETSFTLALDASSYAPGSTARARIAARHTGPDVLQLTFPSSQEYDIVVRDEKDEVVYRWSDGKAFAQVVQTIVVDGERNWAVSLPFEHLAAGQYTAEATLAANPPNQWVARVPFTIAAK